MCVSASFQSLTWSPLDLPASLKIGINNVPFHLTATNIHLCGLSTLYFKVAFGSEHFLFVPILLLCFNSLSVSLS